jgi:hypothetical protein
MKRSAGGGKYHGDNERKGKGKRPREFSAKMNLEKVSKKQKSEKQSQGFKAQPNKKIFGSGHSSGKIDKNIQFLLANSASSNPNPTNLGPYSSRMKILLVGEGDFSFSCALASKIGGKGLTCTSLDSTREVEEKYPNTGQRMITALKLCGARVFHKIDATDLDHFKEKLLQDAVTGFHRIVFNFPHMGGSDESSVKRNQALIRGFFESASSFLLKPTGQVHITLRSGSSFYRFVVFLLQLYHTYLLI